MRRGHRGAVFGRIAAAGHAGAHVHAGSYHLRFDLVPGRWSAGGEASDNVVGVGRAHGDGLREAGRCAHRIGIRPIVAGGKDGHDAGGDQGLHVRAEGFIGTVCAAPGIVDHVGSQVRIAIGGQQPLKSGVNPAIVGKTIVIEYFDRDPLSAGGHTDALATGDSAHGVRPVAVTIARVSVALVGGTEPVARVIVQSLGAVTPVAGEQSRVIKVHAGVHVGHHHAAAVYAQRVPDAVGAHAGDVPFWRLGVGSWKLGVGG